MEKLPMCRICLAENVRMYVVVNKNLRDLYEKLTDNPFVTEDSRPMLACFFCCSKLKQCGQFQRKCLEAEELFAKIMNEDYEQNPFLNQDHPEFFNGLIQSPIVHISIDDECPTESKAPIKQELPAVYERIDDVFEPKEEYHSDGLELANRENSASDVEDIKQHSESDSEDDVPLMEFKIDVEEHEVLRKKWRSSDMQRAPVATIKLEDVITEEQKEYEQSDTTVIQNPQKCTFTTVTQFKEPLPYTTRVTNSSLDVSCRNDSNNKGSNCKISSKSLDRDDINMHRTLCVQEKLSNCAKYQRNIIKTTGLTSDCCTQTGKKNYKCDICQRRFTDKSNFKRHCRLHTGEKPYKCEICQRSFFRNHNLTSHIRTHTEEKPYKCEVCHRSFNHKGVLRIHIRTHTGEKPYECDICQRRFRQKWALITHIRTQYGH